MNCELYSAELIRLVVPSFPNRGDCRDSTTTIGAGFGGLVFEVAEVCEVPCYDYPQIMRSSRKLMS